MAIIGVSGATGRLGGRIARRLEQAGMTQRLLVRDVTRAPQLSNAEALVAPWNDSAALMTALTGLDTVLMVSASEAPDRLEQHFRFVDTAARAGVKQLVYTSFVGAAPDAAFTLARDHYATEQRIRDSGLRFTLLRDNLYADFLTTMVGSDGVLRGPAGEGRVAAVAQDDIADVAAVVLQDPGQHAGQTYDLTGPEALTLDEVAATISAATGRTVRYHPETIEEAYHSRRGYGAPDWQVDAWVSTYTSIAAGELADISPAVAELSGRPATSFADLLSRSGGQ